MPNPNASDTMPYSTPQHSKKPLRESTSMPAEPSGPSSRATAHRRKSSLSLEKSKGISIKTEPKPSRSQGESSAKRKEQNRIAQRAFRKRQKAHLEELEAEVIDKGMRIREINENNGLLLETMKQLQHQNVELKSSRAPNMSGFTMPHLQPTGTPLMPDRGAQGHLPNRGKARGPPSQSESDCGSSIDSQHSSMSSPTGTSPQTIQEEPPGNGPHAAAGTGLQLNLNLKPPSTPHFTTQGGNTPYSAMGGVSPMPGNSHPSYQNPHHRTDRAPRSNAQGPYMGANRNSKSSGLSGSSQVPPGYYNQRNPGPMARRYSDAITRRHVHSMSDPQLLMTATQRPRTSTSDSHSFSKQANHHHSMSVPNTAVLMSHGSPQMMVNRTSESSPSQAGFAAEFFQEQVAFQQPGLHGHVMHHPYPVYSSSSSSNVGLSFSPISQHSASFSNVENPAEYSTSAASASASYFSALSLQPTLPQDQHLFPSDSRVVATEAMADTWADMMPSMGVSTPLQELISGGDTRENVAGSTPQALDQPAHRASHPGSPFIPEHGVFGMNGLDLETEFNFSNYHSRQMFSPPRE